MTKKDFMQLRLGSKIDFGDGAENVLVGWDFAMNPHIVVIDNRKVKHITKEAMIKNILSDNIRICDMNLLVKSDSFQYKGQADIIEPDILKVMLSKKQQSYNYLTKDTLAQATNACFEMLPLHSYFCKFCMYYALSKQKYIVEPDNEYTLKRDTIMYDNGYIIPEWLDGYTYMKKGNKVLLQINEHQQGVIENPSYNITDIFKIKEIVPMNGGIPVSSNWYKCYRKDIVQYVYVNSGKYDKYRNKKVEIR